MLQACMLIQAQIGKAPGAATAVAGLEGVITVSALSGPYDVIVVTRTPDVDEPGLLIMDKVQSVGGIVPALACPVVQL
jgi:hypothetical protein